MKILHSELVHHDIQKLVICSLEQALYQAVVVIDDEEHVVWKDNKQCLRSRNLTSLRECFGHLGINEVVLRQESAYDEMIGAPSKQASNRMDVPLGAPAYVDPTSRRDH